MHAPKIIIDNRERNMDLIGALSDSGMDISFAQLPVGDYIVSDRMCIERKTVSDFESSIMSNRLFEQLDRLRRSFEKPVLIIEGGQEEHRLGDNVVTGAILKLYTDYGVLALHSRDPGHTAAMLSKFAERELEADRKEPMLTGIKKAYTTYQWQALILGSIPGIGPAIAHNLIAHFKTIRNVATADPKELAKVEKIGKKKAERIYEILNAEFREAPA